MNNKDFNLEDLECIRLLAGKELKFLQARREQYEQDDKMPFLKKEKKLEQVNSVGEKGSGMYWFESEKYGKVVIYPKGDKIHIPDRREWVNGVEECLKKNIINEKF